MLALKLIHINGPYVFQEQCSRFAFYCCCQVITIFTDLPQDDLLVWGQSYISPCLSEANLRNMGTKATYILCNYINNNIKAYHNKILCKWCWTHCMCKFPSFIKWFQLRSAHWPSAGFFFMKEIVFYIEQLRSIFWILPTQEIVSPTYWIIIGTGRSYHILCRWYFRQTPRWPFHVSIVFAQQ